MSCCAAPPSGCGNARATRACRHALASRCSPWSIVPPRVLARLSAPGFGVVVAEALEPGLDLGAPVADAAADAETARAGAEVAPIAQVGDRDAHKVGDLGDGEQLVGVVVGLGCPGPV